MPSILIIQLELWYRSRYFAAESRDRLPVTSIVSHPLIEFSCRKTALDLAQIC